EAPFEPTGYIGCAASPSNVTRPCDQCGSGSRSHIGYSQNSGVDSISALASTNGILKRWTCGIRSWHLPVRDQSSLRGGVPASATFTSTAQLVSGLSSRAPSPTGSTTSLPAMRPAIPTERPVRILGQSIAPRQSIEPFQRAGPSFG